VPAKDEEVVIHGPAEARQGGGAVASATRPIFRKEMVVSPAQWTLIIGVILAFFALAVILRLQWADKSTIGWPILAVGALLVAIPACYGGYGILRNDDLQSFLGKELWLRVLLCAGLYAATWLAMPIASFAMHGYDTVTWTLGIGAMLAIGGAIGMMAFDLDYLVGLLHYGMYLGGAIALRWIAGVGVFPGEQSQAAADAAVGLIHTLDVVIRQLV
jgi:hypothetical protein